MLPEKKPLPLQVFCLNSSSRLCQVKLPASHREHRQAAHRIARASHPRPLADWPASGTVSNAYGRRTCAAERHGEVFRRKGSGDGVQQVCALNIDHVLVGQRFKITQFQQRGKTNSGQTRCLDRAKIPTRSLDAENVDFITIQINGDAFT